MGPEMIRQVRHHNNLESYPQRWIAKWDDPVEEDCEEEEREFISEEVILWKKKKPQKPILSNYAQTEEKTLVLRKPRAKTFQTGQETNNVEFIREWGRSEKDN